MKFDFSDISFGDVMGFSILNHPPLGSDAKRVELVDNDNSNRSNALAPTSLPAKAVLSSKGDFYAESESFNYTDKYIDTLLDQSTGTPKKRDSISDFYSDLASPSTKEKNISNQQNTADRHGRT